FLGSYTPEPLGDYFAGPNHTLPTSGTAKFSSPLGVYDFTKRSSILSYSEAALKKDYQKIAAFARSEGLDAHAKSVERRFE
ncbi:MAG: histidinol dehydrogenase, partial [Eubacterium sp.]